MSGSGAASGASSGPASADSLFLSEASDSERAPKRRSQRAKAWRYDSDSDSIDSLGERVPRIRPWEPKRKLLRADKFDSMLICAARGEGKSMLVRYWYETIVAKATAAKGFAMTFVLSRSEPTLRQYAEFVPPIWTPSEREKPLEERNPPINFIDFGTKGEHFLQKLTAAQASRGASAPRVLVILDDVLTKELRYNDAVTQLFTQGRHSHIAVWLISQAFTSAIDTNVRKNSDLMVFLRCRSGLETESIKKEVIRGCVAPEDVGVTELPSGGVPTTEPRLSAGILSECTSNYKALVVDHRVKTTRAHKMLSYFKTPEGFVRAIEGS